MTSIKLATLDQIAEGYDAIEYRGHYIVRDTYGRGVWYVVDELGPNGLPMYEGRFSDCMDAINEVQDEAEELTAAEAAIDAPHPEHCDCGDCQAGRAEAMRPAARVEAVLAPSYVRVTCNNALACGRCKMTAGDVQAAGYRCACSSEGR